MAANHVSSQQFQKPHSPLLLVTDTTIDSFSQSQRSHLESVKRCRACLHSEPIVHKILVKSPGDAKDCYGLEVGKKYSNLRVEGKISTKADSQSYAYDGGWIGGYGPHGNGTFTYISNSQKTQEISANFDRGRFLLKHVPYKYITSTGSIDQSVNLNDYILGCFNSSCPCKNFDDNYESDKSIHRMKNSPAKSDSSKLSSGTIATSTSGNLSTLSSPQITPRKETVDDNESESIASEKLIQEQNFTVTQQSDEILKCYVNVFTRSVTIALCVSYQPIANVHTYVKGTYLKKDITLSQIPITYSGRFDWRSKLLINGSVNGSTSIFTRLLLSMKSAKEEIYMLKEMSKILEASSVNNNKFVRDSRGYCYSSSKSSSSIRNKTMKLDEDNLKTLGFKRIYRLTNKDHLKTVKSLMFYEDYKKLNLMISDYNTDIKRREQISRPFSVILWPFQNEKKFLNNPRLAPFLKQVNKFNIIMDSHNQNSNGVLMTYKLLNPSFSEGFCIEIGMPCSEDINKRISELQRHNLSILIT